MGEIIIATKDKICKSTLGIECIVCGESVPLTYEEELTLYHGGNIRGKVCLDCKATISYMKKQMKKELGL